jgi:hypothetical protein
LKPAVYDFAKQRIDTTQHGFMRGRSTITNLACFSQFLSKCLDNNSQVDVIYTDFCKAFDSIDHYVLIQKLSNFGFSNSLVNLFKSYLVSRTHLVEYQNVRSTLVMPTSGVPQGSNLGPLLLLIFINDLPTVINCHKLLFLDDLKIYCEGDINSLVNWCNVNHLILNIEKCSIMTFSRTLSPISNNYKIGDVLLSRKESVDDLGILFDKGLSFVDHINSITSTAFKNLGYIHRNCKSFRDIACWKLLFFAFVRSKLEYGSLIWYPIYKVHINRVESVQRRFLKFLIFLEEGNYPIQGIDQAVLLQRFNMYSLGVRRIVASVKFLNDLLHNCLDCPPLLDYINFYVPRISSRSFVPFYCDKARKKKQCIFF